MSKTSIGGRSSNAVLGAVTRFGPANPNGLARSDQTESVQNIHAGDLYRQRRMTHHGDAQAGHARLWFGSRDRYGLRPRICKSFKGMVINSASNGLDQSCVAIPSKWPARPPRKARHR